MRESIHESLTVSVAPVSYALTLAEVKTHLRVDDTDQDSLISDLIATAQAYVEGFTRRALSATTYVWALDRFPIWPQVQDQPLPVSWPVDPAQYAIILPRAPVTSVSSIQYYNSSGTLTTLDSSAYVVDAVSSPGRIAPANGSYWPGVQLRPGAVQVTFMAGSSPAPPQARQAMRLLISHWFENREAAGDRMENIPFGVNSLLYQITVPGWEG